MEISLVHPSLNVYGGAEITCLEMIRAIKESDHYVSLFTIDKVDWGLLRKHLGNYPIPDEQFYLNKEYLELKNTLMKWCLLTYSYLNILLRAKKRGTLTVNNYGEVFPFIADISFIHAIPLFSTYRHNRYNPYKIPFWRITSKLYYLLFVILRKLLNQSRVITNSKFNALVIIEKTSFPPVIIYPPVKFPIFTAMVHEKENMVLTVSRMQPMKNLSIVPVIAGKIRGKCRFVLMGGADRHSEAALTKISECAEKLGVTRMVETVLNPNRAFIDRAFSKASVYLSTQPTEAFGIAVVEAMARGCVPIVPRNGGPWFDILDEDQGRYGFAYRCPGEAARMIEVVLSNDELRNGVAKRAQERALSYDSKRFRKEFVRLLENMSS
jgi:glycosyltransferase involved in cell wall biosynthesis